MKDIPPEAAAELPGWVQDGAKLLGEVEDVEATFVKAFPLNGQGQHFATKFRDSFDNNWGNLIASFSVSAAPFFSGFKWRAHRAVMYLTLR